MDRKTLNKILTKFYSQYQWNLEEEKLIWLDESPQPTIDELNSRIVDLEIFDTKDKILNKISHFFDVSARIMLIKNGKTQPIIADLKFRQDLRSAIDQAKNKGFYTHCLTDKDGWFLLEKGKTIDIQISLSGLNKISEIINTRAGYCLRAKKYHIACIFQINTLDEIHNYKSNNCYILDGKEVWKGCNGEDYEVPDIIKVNELGEVVSW